MSTERKKRIRRQIKDDFRLLYKYASGCKFIIETGSGLSTKYLAKAARQNEGLMVSIDMDEDRCYLVAGVEYRCGWSVSCEDIINSYSVLKPKLKKYLQRRNHYLDGLIASGKKELMVGENDLLRKVLRENQDKELDFFFCDTGEYCGIAEWEIVKDRIKVGGYFAAHDIYYPKSIKSFQVLKYIRKSDKWRIAEKTKSRQGLLIAQKKR